MDDSNKEIFYQRINSRELKTFIKKAEKQFLLQKNLLETFKFSLKKEEKETSILDLIGILMVGVICTCICCYFIK